MDELGLFTVALGLSAPWRVMRTEFEAEATQLDLYLGFDRGARLRCPARDCVHGQCPVHDAVERTWRHLDFVQHRALLHARLPRVRCLEHGARQVSVPWARPGSGFTLLFEALVLTFAAAMPMTKVAEMTREHDTRIWRVVEHHMCAARDQLDCIGVRRVGMDETSVRKGQDYISIFADLDARRVIFATEGRSAETVGRLAADLVEHGGDPAKVTDTSSDVSTAFISGIRAYLPNAAITFDRYHLAAKLSKAMDTVRRHEVATRPELKHTRWLWLKNHASLSVTQRHQLHALMPPLSPAGHRLGAALARELPGLLRPAPQLRTRVSATLVLRRETLPLATDHGIPHATACRALGVSQSWFDKWRAGVVPPRAARRERLKAEISKLFRGHEGKYGAPRITAELRDAGWRVSENTVAALMREQDLAAGAGGAARGTTRPGRVRWRAPDLVKRDFAAEAINQKWYGDGTEIPTGGGKLYLASVLDVGSRRVVGFARSEHHDAELAYGPIFEPPSVPSFPRLHGPVSDSAQRIYR